MSGLDIWAGHHSMSCWTSAEQWSDYLEGIERVLGDSIAKLDDRDPVRRSSTDRTEDGDFIAQIKKGESSRWLFGKFKRTKIEFSIVYYRNGKDSFGRYRDNCIKFHIPYANTREINIETFVELFDFTNAKLGIFYAYSDLEQIIVSTKPSGPTLNISRELMGICWLTYFGRAYCEFFGEKFLEMNGLRDTLEGGVRLRLGTSPYEVNPAVREELVQRLGRESFATGAGPKEPGQFVLTIESLAQSTT